MESILCHISVDIFGRNLQSNSKLFFYWPRKRIMLTQKLSGIIQFIYQFGNRNKEKKIKNLNYEQLSFLSEYLPILFTKQKTTELIDVSVGNLLVFGFRIFTLQRLF